MRGAATARGRGKGGGAGGGEEGSSSTAITSITSLFEEMYMRKDKVKRREMQRRGVDG